MVAIEILEDAVLVLEAALPVDWRCILYRGKTSCRLCGCDSAGGRDRDRRNAVRSGRERLRRCLSRQHCAALSVWWKAESSRYGERSDVNEVD